MATTLNKKICLEFFGIFFFGGFRSTLKTYGVHCVSPELGQRPMNRTMGLGNRQDRGRLQLSPRI